MSTTPRDTSSELPSLPSSLKVAADNDLSSPANENISKRSRVKRNKKTGANKDFLSRWSQSNLVAALALTTIGICAFISTWFLMSSAVESTDRNVLISLVVANIVIAVGFALMVVWRFWSVWGNRRNQLAGSRLHMQLARWFALVAIVPAIIAFFFAFMVLRSSLNDVFSERIENYQQTARDIANELVGYVSQETKGQMIDTAIDIHRNEIQNIGFSRTPLNFRSYLEIQARARAFAAIYLISGDKNLVTRIELEEGNFALPLKSTYARLDREIKDEEFVQGVSFNRYWFEINDNDSIDMWRGILKIPDYDNGYLVVYKPINAALAQRIRQVRLITADWEEAIQGRRRLERVFVLGYVILGTTVLFGAIWLALGAATQIVSPIGRLVKMADRVSSGDLSARVSVFKTDGEVGELAKSMNKMTAQLQTQRSDLIDTNKQFDKRRRFTEAVLAGVSAGVLGVGGDGRITIANRSAAVLLGIESNRINGMAIEKLMPEIELLFEEARLNLGREIDGVVEFIRNGRTQTFNVQIVGDQAERERNYVITLDDITQLISAQRNAAWGDVARRIAHEIKNPLTPIQLSAERLQRKYLEEIQTSPDVFEKCTDTIIRQVKDIGRMVDEFSSFARMPKPVIGLEDMRGLTKSAIFPQRVTYPDVEFISNLPNEPVSIECDGRLIVQALTNLIKNAAESITTRLEVAETSDKKHVKPDDTPLDGLSAPGKILVEMIVESSQDNPPNVIIEIVDNGIGLPKEERHRMAEPYMTTREKGTGLGLAIVKKIAEEHGGHVAFEDDVRLGKTGACISLILPIATNVIVPDIEQTEGAKSNNVNNEITAAE